MLTTAADRIGHWIRRHIVPCTTPSKPASDRYARLIAIERSLREQYDALAAHVSWYLAALSKELEAQ